MVNVADEFKDIDGHQAIRNLPAKIVRLNDEELIPKSSLDKVTMVIDSIYSNATEGTCEIKLVGNVGQTNPKAKITWFVNGDQASETGAIFQRIISLVQ